MKFLNLETGYSFDALWNETQEKGYIFWFKNEQSIGLTYTMPIAFITITKNPIKLYMEQNDIFSFICSTDSTTDISFLNEYTTVPEKIASNKYVHIVNVACKSNNAGEYICRINIGDEGYIRVGADFYGEHEPIYITLSNMGVELPTAIQKAIYDANVYEDLTDNILMNRKLKELMSNYWDIIANKGSYKSLLNALEWFEWNDQLKLKEIYKYDKAGKKFFCNKDLTTEVTTSVEKYINDFAKTTYIALYCSLQDELPTYDNEYNPELKQAVFKWCKEDIQLKIALFAKFFGLYFLPIHISILNATAEDIVFTNTIKSVHAGQITRNDCFGSFSYIESSVKNDDVFYLTNVKAQVNDDTIFGVKYPNTEIFGVDIFPTGDIKTDDELKTFSQQYYTGPGAIIPVELILSKVNQKDFVKETIIEYTDDSDTWKQLRFNTIFRPENNIIKIPFNFLAKAAKKYILQFTFILGSSQTISKKIYFNVEDIDNVNINIYKVQAKDDSKGFTYNDFNTIGTSSKYLFRTQKNSSDTYYTQYLPYLGTYTDDYNGIKLNKTVVMQVLGTVEAYNTTNVIISSIGESFINDNFLYFTKQKSDKVTYITFVSKYFTEDKSKELIDKAVQLKYNDNDLLKAIKSDYIFYPQFHNLIKMDGNTITDYTVKPYEALCCAAEISLGSNVQEFKYGHLIDSAEWSFYNNLTDTNTLHPGSSQVPFVADTTKLLENGYYDVSFKCSLNNGFIKEYKLNSAFRIKE